jgi:hypothetical protein
MPIASDSPSTTQPRTNGHLNHACRWASDGSGKLSTEMELSGRRHATDHLDGPRIITPSRTAWPPIEGFEELDSWSGRELN